MKFYAESILEFRYFHNMSKKRLTPSFRALQGILLLLILGGTLGAFLLQPPQYYPKSPNWVKGQFQNLNPFYLNNLWDYFLWQWHRKPQPWPKKVLNSSQPELLSSHSTSQVGLTFIGQASFLIQTSAANILTDPVFSESVGAFGFDRTARIRVPGITMQQLPHIDLVFISHNHVDHMDRPTLESLEARFQPAYVVPLGNATYLKSWGLQNVIELDWWDSVIVKEVRVVMTPARHWSQRTLFDQFKALWGGALFITSGKTIFFAGDTGYDTHFKLIEARYGPVFLSLLPIGSYQPRYFMKDSHMDPAEAVQAHVDLKSRWSVGMHFGTFPDTDEGYDEPLKDLKTASQEKQVTNFKVLNFGETLLLEAAH